MLTYALRLSDIQKKVTEMGDEREGEKIPEVRQQTRDQSVTKRRKMERDASQQAKPEKAANENGQLIQHPTPWKNRQRFFLKISRQTQGRTNKGKTDSLVRTCRLAINATRHSKVCCPGTRSKDGRTE